MSSPRPPSPSPAPPAGCCRRARGTAWPAPSGCTARWRASPGTEPARSRPPGSPSGPGDPDRLGGGQAHLLRALPAGHLHRERAGEVLALEDDELGVEGDAELGEV